MQLATAPVADACLRLNLPLRWLAGVYPLARRTWLSGPVLPVVHYGSVDVFFEAMTRANPGDVLVIDNQQRNDEGCIGDLTAIEAVHYKLGGIIVWGRHRDTSELRRLGLPIFSLGACPMGPVRLDRPPEAREIKIGDVTVSPDDYVFADDDGVLFVAAARASEVMSVAQEIMRSEREQADRVREGVSLHDQFQWDEYARRRVADSSYDFRAHLRAIKKAIEV